MIHATVDHQKQTRSQGWGKPCRQRYVLVPVDRPQASGDTVPSRFVSQFDLLPVYLAGGLNASRLFRNSSFAGRIAREGDRLIEPPPSRGLVATNPRGGPSRGAHVAAPVSRVNHSFQQHSVNAVQSYLAKLPHLFVAFRGGWSSMTNHHPRGFEIVQNSHGEI